MSGPHPTTTTQASSTKEITRAQTKVTASTEKLGGYRQVFAWAAAPLFSADGKLIAQPEVHIDNIQPCNPKESIYDIIAEWKVRRAVPKYCCPVRDIRPTSAGLYACRRIAHTHHPISRVRVSKGIEEI